MANVAELSKLEKGILQLKGELSKISEERWRAALARDEKAVFSARARAAEKTLENCASIATYVANFSAPIAREIQSREQRARRLFEKVKMSNDPSALHSWVKEQLIPSAKFAERMAHMTASSVGKIQGTRTGFHRWAPKQ